MIKKLVVGNGGYSSMVSVASIVTIFTVFTLVAIESGLVIWCC